MANVFVEPVSDGKYQIEFADGSPTEGPFRQQEEAIDEAKKLGHKPLIARVRNLTTRASLTTGAPQTDAPESTRPASRDQHADPSATSFRNAGVLDLKDLTYDECDSLFDALAQCETREQAQPVIARAFEKHTLISIGLTRGLTFWRCRKCETALGWQTVDDLSYPPPDKTPIGRLNEANEPVLYCSTNPLTALNEVRAEPGDFVQAIAFRHILGEETRLATIGDAYRLFRTGTMSVNPGQETARYLLNMLRSRSSDRRFMPTFSLRCPSCRYPS